MKIEELMIGDWYQRYADGKTYQYQVTRDTFKEDNETIANFEPIHITQEILEKNGLDDIPHISIIYVHKIQQFFRINDLIDFANNFKI